MRKDRRRHCDPVFTSLVEKGLVSTEKRKSSNVYIPASPDALVALAEERLREAKASVEASKRVADLLKARSGKDAITSAKILIFEGKRAILQMHYDNEVEWRRSLLESGRAWMGFQDAAYLEHYGSWVQHYWQTYGKAKGWEKERLKLFSAEDRVTKRVAEQTFVHAGERRQLRPLPIDFPFSANFWVVGEYVLLLKTRSDPHYALQIRDHVLAENVRVVFELLWKMSEGKG